MFPPELTPRPDNKPRREPHYGADPAGQMKAWKVLLAVVVIAAAGIALMAA